MLEEENMVENNEKDIHSSLKYTKTGDEYLKGPDQILPSETYFTSERFGAVRIRGMEGKDPAFEIKPTPPPMSIPTLIKSTVNRTPNNLALAMKRNGEYVKWNYEEFYNEVRCCAKAFIHLGLERLHTVAILGYNSPEWFIGQNAAIFAGGIAMGIYVTSSPEAMFYILEHSKSNILLVDDIEQLQKILPYRKKLTDLKAIIQWDGLNKAEHIMTWEQLLKVGSEVNDDVLEDRLKRIAINQACVLAYTSGTTGNPKGVMLHHDNFLTAGSTLQGRVCNGEQEKYVSYLPLSHLAAQSVDMYFQLLIGSEIYFADKDALKGTLTQTLKDVHPTMFLGVPRVYEKICERVKSQMGEMTFLKRMLFDWARSVTFDRMKRKERGDSSLPFGNGLASTIVNKVWQAIGLDKVRNMGAGGMKVSNEVLEFVASLGVAIQECYGLSESCGAHTIPSNTDVKFGSAGIPFPGGKVEIRGKDQTGNGEIFMWGRNIFMGYLDDEEKTLSATDSNGWLATGDQGRIDENNGHVYVTGRIKELLVTSGGENISPLPIEDYIKAELPCISNAMVIGDGKKFIAALLTIKCEMDPVTNEPTDTLSVVSEKWCQAVGSNATTVSEISELKDAKVNSAIEEGMKAVNERAPSNPSRVKKWIILPKDFSLPGEELGPTMKVRRNIVMEKYNDLIESLYN